MTDRPIIFSDAMVRALLAGTKTQTRRVLKPQPHLGRYGDGRVIRDDYFVWEPRPGHVIPFTRTCAYQWFPRLPYAPGDRLWVREAWLFHDWTEDGLPFIRYRAGDKPLLRHPDEEWSEKTIEIWASLSNPRNYRIDGRAADRHWRPSIHMPLWASRLTLTVTDVRVQRVQEISEDDARAEGVVGNAGGPWGCEGLIEDFACLWDSLNAKRGYGWDANPWVVALTFTVHRCNIDQMKEPA